MRSIRNSEGFLKAFVDKQVRFYKHEDIAYRAAFLGRVRNAINNFRYKENKLPSAEELDDIQDKVYDEVNMLNTDEHWEINKANQLEQLFTILQTLHKKARNKEIIINKRYEELSKITAIVDPDKFPIFSLVEHDANSDLVSIWNYRSEIMKQVEKDIGFSLEVKQSQIEHHEAGDGVFLKCVNDEQKVTQGTLLGIVPGVLHSSYEPPQHRDVRVEKDFITCYDQTYVCFNSYLPYPLKFGYSLDEYYDNNEKLNALKGENNILIEVKGDLINPYALGHMINHPPPDASVNVALIDMIIPEAFFPEHLLSFLPYIKYSSDKDTRLVSEFFHNKCYHGLGIIATDDIKDGDELYCDYFEHQRYSMHFTPDWLIRPPPVSPYLKKYEYENDYSFFGRIIDAYLTSKHGNVYDKFVERTAHDQDPQTLLKKTLIKDKIQAKKMKESSKQGA